MSLSGTTTGTAGELGRPVHSGSPARKRDCSGAGDSTATRSRRLSRTLRPAGRSTCGARPTGRSSTRSSHSWTRSSRIAVGSGRAHSRHALSRPRPPGVSRRRRRRRGHGGRCAASSPGLQASMKYRSVSSAPKTGCSRPDWSPPDRFVALFVGKLIPLHGVETILAGREGGAGDRLPPRRQRAARGSTGDAAAERRARAVDRVRAPAGRDPARRLLARNLRRPAARRGASSRTRHSRPSHARRRSSLPTRPAARELLVDEESALLVPPGDAGALARRSAPPGC